MNFGILLNKKDILEKKKNGRNCENVFKNNLKGVLPVKTEICSIKNAYSYQGLRDLQNEILE